MIFKKGDKVEVLDEALSGFVKSVSGNTISIETNDGFEMSFQDYELVKIDSDELKDKAFSKIGISKVISEKASTKRKNTPAKKVKERYQPQMEVDLHIHHLVKSEKGMSRHDKKTLQLDTARHKLEFAMKKNIQKIVFIHGVGEGTLKMELEYLFGRYNNVKYYDADYKKYGLGATEVYIYQSIKPN